MPSGVVRLGEDVLVQAHAAEPPVEVPLPQIQVTPLQVQNPQNGEDLRRRKETPRDHRIQRYSCAQVVLSCEVRHGV